MKPFLYITMAFLTATSAYWTYRESYQTRVVMKQYREIQREIEFTQSRLNVLRTEWAYLNRPDRLRELAHANFDRLDLQQLRAKRFGRIEEIAFPDDELLVARDSAEHPQRLALDLTRDTP